MRTPSFLVVGSCLSAAAAMVVLSCSELAAQSTTRTRTPAATRQVGKPRAQKPVPRAKPVPVAPLTDADFIKALDRAPVQATSIRRLDAGSRKLNTSGWLQARTWSTRQGMRYEVLGSGGSDRVLQKVLMPVLETEVEHSQAQVSPRAAMTTENYAFRVDRRPDQVLVHITARRADVRLINGVATFTPAGVLQRIEGRLADRPSFWVKSVTVVREFAQIGGVSMPRSVESIAEVRLAGLSRFLMTYHYESVNGRAVTGTPAGAVAASRQFTPEPSSHILALHLNGT